MLQPALVFGSGSSIPGGDGGGEDGLNDGSVEVHQGQVHPLLGFFDEGAPT